MGGRKTPGRVPVAPALVGASGNSGKPMAIMAAAGPEARPLGAPLAERTEPGVLAGHLREIARRLGL